jgi:hypothetical protein
MGKRKAHLRRLADAKRKKVNEAHAAAPLADDDDDREFHPPESDASDGSQDEEMELLKPDVGVRGPVASNRVDRKTRIGSGVRERRWWVSALVPGRWHRGVG